MCDHEPEETQPRRSALKVITGALAGAMGLAMAVPPIAALLHPFRKKVIERADGWSDLGSTQSFVAELPKKVSISARRRDAWVTTPHVTVGSVWVVRKKAAEDQFEVLSTVCPHLGCPINLADKADSFACPCHRSNFALSGERAEGPSKRAMDTLETKVENQHLYCRYKTFKADTSEKISTSGA
jgi:menaquinol-cytochrome c reductase iron-sulfur subunit